jgi:rubredoxin
VSDTVENRGVVGPDGRPARWLRSSGCPQCGAGRDKRVNTAGFGAAVICCSVCGWEYVGEAEA